MFCCEKSWLTSLLNRLEVVSPLSMKEKGCSEAQCQDLSRRGPLTDKVCKSFLSTQPLLLPNGPVKDHKWEFPMIPFSVTEQRYIRNPSVIPTTYSLFTS